MISDYFVTYANYVNICHICKPMWHRSETIANKDRQARESFFNMSMNFFMRLWKLMWLKQTRLSDYFRSNFVIIDWGFNIIDLWNIMCVFVLFDMDCNRWTCTYTGIMTKWHILVIFMVEKNVGLVNVVKYFDPNETYTIRYLYADPVNDFTNLVRSSITWLLKFLVWRIWTKGVMYCF